MKRIYLSLVLLLSTIGAFAEGPASYGFWPGYYGHASISKKFGVWLEAQPRMYDFAGDLEQLLLRTSVTYKLSPDVQVAQGYGYVRSEPYITGTEQKRVTKEHRVYQQLVLRQRWGRLHLQHRYRVEERFLADNNFRMRFRYFLGANLCLNEKELKEGTLYLSGYNEAFLHTDKPVFDRNRLYGGIGYGLSNSVRIEAGHMWQMQEATTRPQLQLMLWHNFKL
jgi:hypothetical protein